MLDFLLMMSSLVSTVKFEEEILESRINKSFYLYTAESIDKIRYRDFPHSKNHDSPSIEKISLLSHKNINIDDINISDFIIQNLYKITYQIIPGLTAKICLLNSSEMPVISVDIFEEEKKSENKFFDVYRFF